LKAAGKTRKICLVMRKSLGIVLLLFFSSWFCNAQSSTNSPSFIQNNPNIYSLVVSRNDSVIYKKFFNQKKERGLFNNQSLTKSIVAILIGIAIDKGYLISVDEEIIHFFPELKKDSDILKHRITVRQIMNQASGLWHENLDSLGAFLAIKNPSRYVLRKPLVSEPGTTFQYNNAASHLLSVILSKSTGYPTLEFAKKFLFSPLGITRVKWKKMHDGYFDGSGLLSVYLNTQDMNKIGRLILDSGIYKKKQIISKKWIEAILNPTLTYPAPWGFEDSRYAMCWYHCYFEDKYLTYAMGWGGQFLILVPDLHAVISVNQNSESATAIKQSDSFISDTFPLLLNYLQ
jgi:CubicO group peptidase (beta-lactamase class C family)